MYEFEMELLTVLFIDLTSSILFCCRSNTMKLKLPVVIACIIAEVVSATYISITNQTPADIHVRVTTTGSASESFYGVAPGNTESWSRSYWEVAFILRNDTGATETLVVKPDNSYTIS